MRLFSNILRSKNRNLSRRRSTILNVTISRLKSMPWCSLMNPNWQIALVQEEQNTRVHEDLSSTSFCVGLHRPPWRIFFEDFPRAPSPNVFTVSLLHRPCSSSRHSSHSPFSFQVREGGNELASSLEQP